MKSIIFSFCISTIAFFFMFGADEPVRPIHFLWLFCSVWLIALDVVEEIRSNR